MPWHKVVASHGARGHAVEYEEGCHYPESEQKASNHLAIQWWSTKVHPKLSLRQGITGVPLFEVGGWTYPSPEGVAEAQHMQVAFEPRPDVQGIFPDDAVPTLYSDRALPAQNTLAL